MIHVISNIVIRNWADGTAHGPLISGVGARGTRTLGASQEREGEEERKEKGRAGDPPLHTEFLHQRYFVLVSTGLGWVGPAVLLLPYTVYLCTPYFLDPITAVDLDALARPKAPRNFDGPHQDNGASK